MKRRITLLAAMALVLAALAPAVASADPSITPETVEAVVYPGESIDIAKTVGTPEVLPDPAIVFLADTTGSMTDVLANVSANGTPIMNAVLAAQPTAQFAAAEYRDVGDTPVFAVNIGITADTSSVQTAMNGWSAGGGGDTQEAQLNALTQLATGAVTFPAGSTPIIVWFGDASGHDPSLGATLATTIADLQAPLGITVIAIDTVSGYGDGLDNTGQATAITSATDGVFLTAPTPEDTAAAILAGLANLPLDVSLSSNCAAPISTTFTPEVNTVTSGDDASFTETIAVAVGAAGGTYTCSDVVWYGEALAGLSESKTIHVPGITLEPETDDNELTVGAEHTVTATVAAGDDGPLEGVRVEFEIVSGPNAGPTGSGTTDSLGQVTFTWVPGDISPSFLGMDTVVASFTDEGDTLVYGSATATKTWVDTTPPEAACLEFTNPHGKTKPVAPGNGGQGQNQDGFYELFAEDEVWPGTDLELFITDTGSGTVFGPFDVGTTIKYTED